MPLSDDDDFLPESSKDYSKADLGHKDLLREKIQKEMGDQKASEVLHAELQSKSDLQSLKDSLAGAHDEETKRKQDEAERKREQSSAPKTKSLKEEEQSAVETAQDQATPDQLLQQQQSQPDVSDEETQTQPG